MTVHTKERILRGMVKVRLWGFRCERCSHEWLPREKDRQPKVCPKCKSPYWDRPRREPKEQPSEPVKGSKAKKA